MTENIIKNGENTPFPVPAALTAKVVGTSADNVRKVRNGKRGSRSSKVTIAVQVADEYLGDGMGKLVEAAKRIVKI
jgi:hypothetical protein